MRSGEQPDSADARNLDQITTSLERLRGGDSATSEREHQRRSVLAALRIQLRSAVSPAAARRRRISGQVVRQQQSQPARRRFGGAVRHLPHDLRADMRRLLLPDLVCHVFRAVPRRRADVSAHLSSCGSLAVHVSQPRRRRSAGRVVQRPALCRPADRISVSQGVEPVVQLPPLGRKLGRCSEESRRAAADPPGDVIVTEQNAKRLSQPPQLRSQCGPIRRQDGTGNRGASAAEQAPTGTRQAQRAYGRSDIHSGAVAARGS